MKPFGTPNKLKSLNYDSGHDEVETGVSTSLDRHQRSMNDRDRRRQIIAKLAQKRKQYQRGIGTAERESFQRRVKTSIIKHKQQQQTFKTSNINNKNNNNNNNNNNNKAIKAIQPILIRDNESERKQEEEHKSISISTSLSISPIHPQNNNNNNNNKHNNNSQQSLNLSKSASNSPCLSSQNNNSMYIDGLDIDVRSEEIRMLKAQNQRLSNKLDHVNTELVEIQVFLRSERKRNKNLFNELKLKEDEITDLNEQIDGLEIEIEEKDKKCIECVEKLSEFEQRNKNLSEIQQINTNLSNKIKQCYHEIKEWQNKYYDVFEKYSSNKNKHKQQINDLNHELKQQTMSETENMNKLNQLIQSQNSEIDIINKENEILINMIHSITKTMQTQIKSDKTDCNVLHELNSMLSSSSNASSNDNNGAIDVLLQSLIGVIDKSDRLEQHNKEISLCLNKYETDIEITKNTIIEYEEKYKIQQQRLQKLQDNYTILSNEKLQIDNKCNETTKELQKLYERVFTATDELQNITVQITNKQDIGDIDMNQCIEIIRDSVENNRMNTKKLNILLVEIMNKYYDKMESIEKIFKNVTGNWSNKIHGLQDKLSNIQLQLIRNQEININASDLSNMSIISDVNRSSFHINDIQQQFSQQMALINELKHEINDKQQTIDTLINKTDHIQNIEKLQCEIKALRKERDDALNDFQTIAQEWENMESHIDITYNKNESLQKQINNLEYWINYIVEYINQRINNGTNSSSYQLQFESISTDIPKQLHKLHHSLMFILTRMDVNDLNDTMVDDINDDVLLEQIFGKIESNEDTQIELKQEEDIKNKTEQKEQKEKETKLETTINTLSAEICLESIIHKIELSHVGNEAEKIIIAYQERLKTYHNFIRQLQCKISESSKLMHSISLERDHAWSQYKGLQNQVNKLTKENGMLQCSLSENEEKLENKTKELNNLKQEIEENDMKIESMRRQLQLNEDRNSNIDDRLHESTLMIQEITNQRNELEQECIALSNKFIEYKTTSDTLFKHSCDTMVESLHPLMIKLNQYSMLSKKMEDITEKIKYLKDHLKKDKVSKKQEKENEILEIKKECEKSSICKLRIHADIHRFQFVKLLQEMKQKYGLYIEELESRINCLQNKLINFSEIQDSYSSLQNQFNQQKQNKIMIESQLIQLKKSFNEEIVNYQNVQNQNKQNEIKLNGIINNLKKEMNKNIKKREDIQEKLNEQTKKTKKLHSKAIKLQSEIKEIKPKYNELRQKLENIQNENKDYKLQIEQLKALNISLKEAIKTKDINHTKMNDIHNANIDELRQRLKSMENTNIGELQQYIDELERVQKSNREFAEKLEIIKNERLLDERKWFDKEEDLRNEVNIIRQQLHGTTNDLGMMKLDSLEKETMIKKLENEINGLNEQILFYKECEEKDKNEKKILSQQISEHNKANEQKIKDIEMLLDSKSVRIMRLNEEKEDKINKIKELESQIIALNNELSTAQTLMNEEKCTLKTQNNENNKLQMIINDLSKELDSIKTEKGKLFSQLETQKNVNVQLSIELDSMKQFVDKKDLNTTYIDVDPDDNDDINVSMIKRSMTDDVLNTYSTLSFYDKDLENKPTSLSMPNMNDDDDNNMLLNNFNLATINKYSDNRIKSNNSSNYADIHTSNKNEISQRRRPGLPLPKTGKIYKRSTSKSLFGDNTEEIDKQ